MDAVEATSDGSDERLAALQQLAAHPCSWHCVLATDVWAEISDLHRQRRDWDHAIAAWEQTIQLGYRSRPHPRAQIAELLVLAGRRDEGDALYAQLLDRFPRDVWLRNNAALTYLDVAAWATALWWIDTALDLTMNDGDQVGLIDQLVEMRSRALAALGRRSNDDIGRRAAAFVPSPRSRPAGVGDSWGEIEPSTERCEHCGGQPDHVGWIPTGVNDDSWTVQSLTGSSFPAVSSKVPRNSSCPCGSGLKAKKCCHR